MFLPNLPTCEDRCLRRATSAMTTVLPSSAVKLEKRTTTNPVLLWALRAFADLNETPPNLGALVASGSGNHRSWYCCDNHLNWFRHYAQSPQLKIVRSREKQKSPSCFISPWLLLQVYATTLHGQVFQSKRVIA